MPSDPLVQFEIRTPGLDRSELAAFAATLVEKATGGERFCCRISSDGELRWLNQHFRGKDEPTDVLSFPAPGAGEGLGDIAISIHRAAEQAAEHGHSTAVELRILMLHGVLHLLGFDHENDRGRMRRAETKWRKQLDLPTGLIERAGRRR
jgi:probable rRNA maturation factor